MTKTNKEKKQLIPWSVKVLYGWILVIGLIWLYVENALHAESAAAILFVIFVVSACIGAWATVAINLNLLKTEENEREEDA